MAKYIMSIKWLFILSLLLLVAGISISSYIVFYYIYQNNVEHHIDTVSEYFQAEMQNIVKPVETFLYNVKSLICCDILNFNEAEKTNKFMMQFMKLYPYVTSINYGDAKGNGYLILNDRGSWLNRIKKANEKDYVTWHQLDSTGKIIKTEKKFDKYDPRETVWYKQAKESGMVLSREYIFRTTKDPGVTASLLLCRDKGAVLGVDMMIKDLSNILKTVKDSLHKEAKIYLVSDSENVIAFSEDGVLPVPEKIYTINQKEFPLLYQAFIENKTSAAESFNIKNWYVRIKNWTIGQRQLSLYVFVPMDIMIKNLNLLIFYQVFASLLLTLFVLFYISKKYINPIIDISRQVVNIGQKELSLEQYRDRTDEIGSLSRAVKEASDKILQIKELEEKIAEQKRFEAVRTSLNNAVHRFKDLINAIQGFATVAQSRTDNAFAKNALDQIANSAKRALELTKEILTVTGERKYEMSFVNLNHIILSMKSKIELYSGDSIKTIYELSKANLSVKLDISAFDEVVMNLISNAKDAMAEGGILKIRTSEEVIDNKRFAVLSISDTGTGIDEETKNRIFEPFFTTKGAKGTGLGLSIVYRIMQDHNGFITVESEVGKGTTFKLYFPAVTE